MNKFKKIVQKVICSSSTLIYLLCPKYLSICVIYFFKSVTLCTK